MISRRAFLQFAAGASLFAATGQQGHAQNRPPNVVLIYIDDLGWRDLACYGGELFETPHIDKLAAEGMRFTQAYANCPVCSPSRAALMTGKNPARLGFTGHITAIGRHRHPEGSRLLPPDDKTFLPLDEVTIADALKSRGYVSASIGKWHLGPEGFWPEDQGFDVNVGGWTHGSPPSYFHPYTRPSSDWNPSIPTLDGGEDGDYLTDRLTDEAIGFIESNKERPFFLYLTHYAVHTPLQAPKDLVEKYRTKLEGTDAKIDPIYAAMVENMDTNVGRVLETLERLDLEEDTLVIFSSDNGGWQRSASNAPLREGKGWLYEGGIRVPQIMRWPGRIDAGVECDVPTMGTDLYSTILDVAGADVPESDIDGVSVAPLWDEREYTERESFYWYYPHYHSTALRPGAAVRKGDYKLIETYDPQGVELYDLRQDLSETTNLAERMPEKTAELLAELRGYLDDVSAIPPTLNPDRS